jgi:hypothetical protein
VLDVKTSLLGESAMAFQLVMDHSGDTRHWYDVTDERSADVGNERVEERYVTGGTVEGVIARPRLLPVTESCFMLPPDLVVSTCAASAKSLTRRSLV